MEDNGHDEHVAKNGFSSILSSPDSVDALVPTESTETSGSDLPSTSGYRPLDNSTTGSTQSKSPLASTSDGTISDLSSDVTTPVNESQSQSVASDYSGTRFVVKRMESSELQSSSNSPSKVEKTPSQSPKSVKFVQDEAGPSKGKSPEKSPSGGLSKSITTSALSKLVDLEPKELFSPKSQDSFESKEEIELPTMKRKIISSSSETDDEDFFAGVDIVGDRSNMPLLSDSDSSSVNRPKTLKTIDVAGPDGTISTVAVEEVLDSPGASSEGTTTVAAESACQKCIMTSTFLYIALVILIFSLFGVVYGALGYAGYFSSSQSIAKNDTATTTTAFPLTTLNADNIRKASGELPFSAQLPAIPETTTNELPTAYVRDEKEGATNAPNFDDTTTTTANPVLSSDQ